MTRSSRALILLNGDLGQPEPVRRAARECSTVICADGGARHAAILRLKPRLVLGDMDSLPARLPRWRDTVFLCDFEQDCSDFEKTLRFARENGFAEAWVAGAFGGLDYTLVNFAVAERYAGKLAVRFIGQPEARLLGPGSHRLPCRRGRRVTLLARGERARLSTRGLLHPLKDEWLEPGSRGLSNRSTASTIHLTIRRGRIWVIY